MVERILVAEDDDNVRLMLIESLMLAGYSVSAVDNGLDLMRLAASSSGFDLIITDVCMPKGEGDDMIALLREKKSKPRRFWLRLTTPSARLRACRYCKSLSTATTCSGW